MSLNKTLAKHRDIFRHTRIAKISWFSPGSNQLDHGDQNIHRAEITSRERRNKAESLSELKMYKDQNVNI